MKDNREKVEQAVVDYIVKELKADIPDPRNVQVIPGMLHALLEFWLKIGDY